MPAAEIFNFLKILKNSKKMRNMRNMRNIRNMRRIRRMFGMWWCMPPLVGFHTSIHSLPSCSPHVPLCELWGKFLRKEFLSPLPLLTPTSCHSCRCSRLKCPPNILPSRAFQPRQKCPAGHYRHKAKVPPSGLKCPAFGKVVSIVTNSSNQTRILEYKQRHHQKS